MAVGGEYNNATRFPIFSSTVHDFLSDHFYDIICSLLVIASTRLVILLVVLVSISRL